MKTPTAFPLDWPSSMPKRKNNGTTSQFKTSLSKALENVRRSLEMFGRDAKKPITGIIVSSNVTLGMQNPQASGVSVWFLWEGQQRVIPVDRYKKVQDNLQAIHHIIEARRTELRHGGIEIVRASFSGFSALPAPISGGQHWTTVLNIPESSTRDAILAKYRSLSKTAHPDTGGSEAKMTALNVAKDEALKAVA